MNCRLYFQAYSLLIIQNSFHSSFHYFCRLNSRALDSTTLCFDFGNTRLKAAVFIDSALEEVVVLKEQSIATVRSLLDQFRPTKSILSSVIDHDPEIEDLLFSETRFHKLTHLSQLPFTTP